MAAIQSHCGCERHSSKLDEVTYYWSASKVALVVKNLPATQDTKEMWV